ncbi:MAG: polysaccharide pyruvyl transferase CsaB [Oscillatoriales cyanobacterium RM2_1_1]|nr:polysaccharide pyruvyl transferase CsaB [Oscillatoriales cyanobacterium SM2_3_0]NJO44710.1 polysaccharide pyruvyl transferase CsaB [Oscillatoriales cyanobacterium RM2_1_1]
MKRVICSGYYGQGNAGDEALLATLLQMLPSEIEPIVLSGNPARTRAQYQVETYNRKSALDILQALRQAEGLIWGGGSLMQDVTSALSPFYYAGLMGMAQQQGLKTLAWAQGIGPLNRSTTQWMARRAFMGCSAVSVRDKKSAELLTQWQVPFTLAPDPVWALTAQSAPGLGNLHFPRVAVTLRSHPQINSQRLGALAQALKLFQKATDTSILLIPFQPSQDLAIAQLLHQVLPDHSQILTLEDPRQIKGIFQGVEMVIGMRYHSLIMAAAEQCRCFAISYDPKVTQLMAELELPGWEVDQLPEDANAISMAWLEHYANGDSLDPARIEFLVDRAKVHQGLLQATFCPS